MIADDIIPSTPLSGVWIDLYNKTINTEYAGTIHTRISHGNYWYVTEIKDTASDEDGIH